MSSTDKAKITVVIPTFNRRISLQNTIESVLEETRVPIQVCVFDNASSDQTEAYIKALMQTDSRVSYVRNATNIGPIANFQRALDHVETDYFIPLADDDWLLPGFIWEAFQILRADQELGAAVFVTEMRDESDVLLRTYPESLDKLHFGKLTPQQHLRDWMTYGHYGWSAILWRSSVLAFIKPPYLHVGLPSDVDFQAQIFSHFPAYLVNKPGAVYLVHPEQGSQGMNMASLSSWSRLFRRLDKQILQRGLFSTHEYISLRAIALARYDEVWRKPASELSRITTIRLATLAGVVLNDWDSAMTLANRIPTERLDETSRTTADRAFYFIPKLSDNEVESQPALGLENFRLIALQWAHSARQKIALQTDENSRLENENAQLRTDNTALAQRNATLAGELDHSTGQLAALTTAHNEMNTYLLALVQTRLFRFLLKWGLLPLPQKSPANS